MPEFVDPYVDTATGILRNLVGVAAQDELDQIEADPSWRTTTSCGA